MQAFFVLVPTQSMGTSSANSCLQAASAFSLGIDPLAGLRPPPFFQRGTEGDFSASVTKIPPDPPLRKGGG
ncbi:MAG: hypothetical protein B6245_10860 [Desulfobacteraceae bacterium 4572_88]|nr:MAG: hypothetical protein B6245_10860 [Desulfobacteraceae bacterium 4572_88]